MLAERAGQSEAGHSVDGNLAKSRPQSALAITNAAHTAHVFARGSRPTLGYEANPIKSNVKRTLYIMKRDRNVNGSTASPILTNG
jgi:hypothetical protein